ncbi:MAG: type IV pilin protein [Paraburkholderia sp.]|jgi:type IV pilus assembly protein PilE|uniref:type IV pilin protein n=1 Tax=Burkholderiaceae TaxID=119060 RepID=UPI0010FA6211|nr:type IV pilin protein [Burkholderia sp. 4M9327F10]
MRSQRSKPRLAAFTLLELIIALAIAAILVVYAVPSYRGHVARSHRIDAASALYRAAQFMEAGTSGEVSSLPAGLDQAPPFGTPVYRLQALPADEKNGGYAVEARPLETGPMHDDPCGIFILDATGLRTNRPMDGAAAPDSDLCWSTK